MARNVGLSSTADFFAGSHSASLVAKIGAIEVCLKEGLAPGASECWAYLRLIYLLNPDPYKK